MALIQCSECNNTVSNKAVACPHCGAPVARAATEYAAIGTRVSTVQETSKRLKLNILFSALFWWTGFIWLMVELNSVEGPSRSIAIAGLLLFVGGVWYLITKFRIWWHHK